MGCGASSAPKAEDEPPVRASESIDHAATRVSASKSADAKPLEETVDEKDDGSASEIPPRERSERRKFWPYGRKSRPPNALLLCARVIRGGEHPSRHKRFGRTNVADLVGALVS